MHIISMRRLQEFWRQHPDAENPLRAWYTYAKRARWQNFVDVRRDLPATDQVRRLTVFNIGGNKYRLVVRMEYERQRIYIRAVMTHAEYDKDRWKDDPWYE
jgi:mRNA interferase HigB